MHLIRNAMKYVGYQDRKKVAKAMRPIYTAPTIDAAADALDDFELKWGERYPAAVKVWRDAWERFIPFLAFDPAIRKIIYTSNAVESLNYQLRKITKTKGHFPTDDAVLKILYLGIRNIGSRRGGELSTGTWGWKRALNAFAIPTQTDYQTHSNNPTTVAYTNHLTGSNSVETTCIHHLSGAHQSLQHNQAGIQFICSEDAPVAVDDQH